LPSIELKEAALFATQAVYPDELQAPWSSRVSMSASHFGQVAMAGDPPDYEYGSYCNCSRQEVAHKCEWRSGVRPRQLCREQETSPRTGATWFRRLYVPHNRHARTAQ